MVDVNGTIEPGFEKVGDAFAANFAEHDEVGAGFCLYVDGREVVNITGGVADRATGRAYDADTLQLVFSTTKGATAVCASLLVQRGELDVDAPVASYWPEFKAQGKESIPVAWLLGHSAGLPVIDKKLTLDEVLAWTPVVEALAEQKPVWEPGTAHGYHGLTYGWLVGEVVRRISGRSLGRFFADEVAAPLGLEFWIGLPAEHEPRVAPLLDSPPPTPEVAELMMKVMGPGTLGGRMLSLDGALTDPDGGNTFNKPAVHQAEIPAANGITNARSLARMYAGLVSEVDGVRLLTPETVEGARTQISDGPDLCLTVPTRFGRGFFLDSEFSPLLGRGSFGHAGAGGSLGFADPEAKVGFGYVMNQMAGGLAGDPRTIGLIAAVRASLG